MEKQKIILIISFLCILTISLIDTSALMQEREREREEEQKMN